MEGLLGGLKGAERGDRGYSGQGASEAGERGALSPSDLESPSSRQHRVLPGTETGPRRDPPPLRFSSK